MDPVIEVRDHQVELVQLQGAMQEIEQRHRVGAAGDRDQRSAARQVERGQMAPEIVEQRRHVSSTSRTLRERSPGMNGFCRNGDPGRRRPRRTTSSSV